MTNKLPAFFVELLDERFAVTNKKIDELKLHVNDEVRVLKRYVIMIGVVSLALVILHIDEFGSGFLASLRKFIGL